MNCMLRLEHLDLFRLSIRGVELDDCFSPEDGEHLAFKALGFGHPLLLIQVLLEEGMSRDVKEKRGSHVQLRYSCPRDISMLFGEERTCPFLVDAATAIKKRDWSAACVAIQKCKDLNGGESLVDLVVESEMCPESMDCLKLLLTQGAAIGGSLVFAISLNCSLEVVAMFLDFGKDVDLNFIDPRFHGRSALCCACESGAQTDFCMLTFCCHRMR